MGARGNDVREAIREEEVQLLWTSHEGEEKVAAHFI